MEYLFLGVLKPLIYSHGVVYFFWGGGGGGGAQGCNFGLSAHM